MVYPASHVRGRNALRQFFMVRRAVAQGMRYLLSALLAVASGITAIVAASASLAAINTTPMMGPVMRQDPTPAYLLLALGLIILINGVILFLQREVPMRAQGATMVTYGILMVIVGTAMAFSSLYPMGMAMLSAWLMYILGGLMIASGSYMLAQTGMLMAPGEV